MNVGYKAISNQLLSDLPVIKPSGIVMASAMAIWIRDPIIEWIIPP